MYSLMNSGNNYFFQMHGEQVLTNEPQNGLLVETVSEEVLEEILEEPFEGNRIFLDTQGITFFNDKALETLLFVTEKLFQKRNEIYFLGKNTEIRDILCSLYEKKGYQTYNTLNEETDYWYLTVREQGSNFTMPKVWKCTEAVCEVHRENICVLVQSLPTGKELDIKRLMKDGEKCVYYYCYMLAIRLIESGLLSPDNTLNKDICLVAINESGYYVAVELCKILGTSVCRQQDLHDMNEVYQKYILVREIIHMDYELNAATVLIESKSGIVCGSACIMDINTGVGKKYNRVSVYTYDLEKGISYKIKNRRSDD